MKFKDFIKKLFKSRYLDISKLEQLKQNGITPVLNSQLNQSESGGK